MRHRMAGRKLGRKTNHRIAMWRNMAVSLFTHGQITTTLPKAKSVQPFVEKLITLARRGDLAARRQVMSMIGEDHIMIQEAEDPEVPRNAYGEIQRRGGRKQGPRIIKHLFDEIAPRYATREGGYTRIIKLARYRIGDGADLCVLQLISDEDTGPQVAGKHSRRREKANRRMAFAAKLRKGGADSDAPAVEEDAPVAQAEAPEPAEEQAPQTPEPETTQDDATPSDEGEQKS